MLPVEEWEGKEEMTTCCCGRCLESRQHYTCASSSSSGRQNWSVGHSSVWRERSRAAAFYNHVDERSPSLALPPESRLQSSSGLSAERVERSRQSVPVPRPCLDTVGVMSVQFWKWSVKFSANMTTIFISLLLSVTYCSQGMLLLSVPTLLCFVVMFQQCRDIIRDKGNQLFSVLLVYRYNLTYFNTT